MRRLLAYVFGVIFFLWLGLDVVFAQGANQYEDFFYHNMGIDSHEDYFKRGYLDLQNGNYEKAFANLVKAHNKGNVDATYWVGECYFSGWGVEIDEKKGFDLIQSAANKGQKDACYVMGVVYCNGLESQHLSIKSNLNRGMEWLKIASNKNHPEAQWLLGDLYYVNADKETAFAWYSKSASLNSSMGVKRVGVRLMDGDGVSRDVALAIEYLKKAKEMGCDGMDLVLGKAYYWNSDFDQCIQYFKASKQNSGEDSGEEDRWIGSAYASMTPADYKQALNYWEKAAEKDELLALYYSALCYYEGLGCQKDYNRAVEYFQRILKPGENISVDKEFAHVYGISAKFLGNCYRYGRGVDADQNLAQSFNDIAKKLGWEDITVREVMENLRRVR